MDSMLELQKFQLSDEDSVESLRAVWKTSLDLLEIASEFGYDSFFMFIKFLSLLGFWSNWSERENWEVVCDVALHCVCDSDLYSGGLL